MTLYLATASRHINDYITAGIFGQLITPDTRNRIVPDAVWAADNGCYNRQTFSVAKWLRWLDQMPRTALWATVPDWVGDHEETLRQWEQHAPTVIDLGYKPAFVAQDGCTPEAMPDNAACCFLGGSTEWKLSWTAQQIVSVAQARGLMTHMGRVNSLRRLRIAAMWGMDTADGTFIIYGPEKNVPQLLEWVRPAQPSLFGGIA